MTDKYYPKKTNPSSFDIFNFKYYLGANPYLNVGALVFDFALIERGNPLVIDTYKAEIIRDLPQLTQVKFTDYADLFARTVAEVNKLEMELHLEKFSLKKFETYSRIAIQSLDSETTKSVVDFVWDWLEAITDNEEFDFQLELPKLQQTFRYSVYGGPTAYSIIRAAYYRGVPSFYLPDERLMQFGYGKYQVRGVGTTFDCDSQLDSDFTTNKDDCKAFLANCGFPVPQGRIISSLEEAFDTVKQIGYPVAVKPVVGHKGIGVTANVLDARGLEFAYDKAKEAIASGSTAIIVEKSITGADFRLLCVNGKFLAAVERRPAYVIGDGKATIEELIEAENATEARLDTPTSPLGKIITDEVMENYLAEQNLSLDTVLDQGEIVYLRKVANLSSGGISIDATQKIHPDNAILAQEIAQYFRLVCLGIDVIAKDISQSWKSGAFGIIEINAAPGIFMHLKPAQGESVDVPGEIVNVLFPPNKPCDLPIITFNLISLKQIKEIIANLLLKQPNLIIGAVCREGVLINCWEKTPHKDYNSDVQSLLRHPKLDLLIAEYPESIFTDSGMFYTGSNIVVLNDPTETEKIIAEDLLPSGTLIIKEDNQVNLQVKGLRESYQLDETVCFSYIYQKEINRLIDEIV